jgi:amino acid adenylation domain-containing protein
VSRRSDEACVRLRGVGVVAGSAVVLCAERSADMVVWMLGIMKAGAAYVPIEPTLPTDRLSDLLRDAMPAAVVWPKDKPVCSDPPVLRMEASRDFAPEAEPTLPVRVLDSDAAYVIYTSGSTGMPKGVVVEHRQLRNYVRAIIRRLELPGSLRYAMVSTPAADLGHTVLFPSLLTGGELHILGNDCATDGRAFLDYCREHSIDCLKIVPTHLAALLPENITHGLLPRRRLIMGGEALQGNLVASLARVAGACRLFNHYGPTETTVGVLAYRITERGPFPDLLPLGRPLDNVRAYVLDASLALAAIGVPGQLFIGGLAVTRGYLRRPALTAERYLPDPFAASSGARMYATGDWTRWRADGQIEFLGRIDNQVKVRGFRIELGEIEANLLREPDVRECIVVAREDLIPGKRLVAYVVGDADERNLREALQSSLPEYMVPTTVVLLKKMPLTPNGKVDRKALPEPEARSFEAYVGPRDGTEATLVSIWREVLRIERVGIDDNFFELGGHSLLAIRVVARIQAELGVRISVRAAFQTQTIRALARAILDAPSNSALPSLRRVPHRGQGPLSFNQLVIWSWQRRNPNAPSMNFARAVALKGRLDIDALTRAADEELRRHEILRTTFAPTRGEPVQVIVAPPKNALERFEWARSPEECATQAHALVANESLRTMDLGREPLVRLLILQLAEREHLLALISNRILLDPPQSAAVFAELLSIYDAFSRGEPSPLAEPALQYLDYVAWQRQLLASVHMKKRLDERRRRLCVGSLAGRARRTRGNLGPAPQEP